MKKIFKYLIFFIFITNIIVGKKLTYQELFIGKEKLLEQDNQFYTKGMISYQQGNYEKAIQYFQKSLIIRKQVVGGEKHDSISILYNNIGEMYRLLNNYPKAVKNLKKSILILEKLSGVNYHNMAINYDTLGLIYAKMENYPKALAYNLKALKIFEKLFGENHVDTIKCYNNISSIYINTKKYKKALKYVTKTLKASKKVAYTEQIIIGYSKMATIFYNLKKNKKAIEYAKKSLKLSKESNDIERIVISYENLGMLYTKIGKYNEAIAYYQHALKIKEKYLGFHVDTATTYHDIALIYHEKLEDFLTALEYHKKALAIREELLGQDIDTGKTYNNIGTIYRELGDFEKSIDYFNRALYIFKREQGTKEHALIATVINNMASSYLLLKDTPVIDKIGKISGLNNRMKNIARALLLYKQAINISEKVNDKLVGISYGTLARLLRDTGNYEQSLEYYKKALKKNKKIWGENHPYTINIYADLGHFYILTKNYKKAFFYINKALNLRKLSPSHQRILESYGHLGLYYFKIKKYDKSYKNFLKAFNLFSLKKNKTFFLLNSLQKEKFLKYRNPFILNLLYSTKYFNTLNTKKTTINSWLNYKGSIFDNENSIATLYQNTKDKALKEQIETLMLNQRGLATLYQNIPKDMKKWKEQIKAQEEKISELTTEIAQKSSIFQEQQGLKSIGYKAISKNLKENELYIDYAKAGDYYIFTLNKKEEIGFIEIDENSTKKIDDLIMSFRKDIDSLDKHRDREQQFIKSSKEKLAELYNLLIKNPLKDKLNNKTTLIISPDGALKLLPFETLYDREKKQYLIENREIRYIPSGKELVRLHKYSKNLTPKSDEVVIFANPNFDSNETALYHEKLALTRGTNEDIIVPFFTKKYDFLAGSKMEAEEISKIMQNTKVFEWNRANETNLLGVKKPKILHIATHGFFINTSNIPNPMLKSGIVLTSVNHFARRKKGYGMVTALKLSGLDLRGTNLVVLSACDTGVVDINDTDSISGLGKAFIQAGAKDVVMSLWSVDDSATRNLMVSFYKKIKAKENKKEKSNYAKALKDAKMEMIEKNRHPFYWGGFILLGL